MEEDREMKSLIPGLPDDISMECMVRVPYKYHSTMKSVCYNWRNFVSSSSFYKQRRSSRQAERLVCLVQPTTISTPEPEPKSEEEEESTLIGESLRAEKKQSQIRSLPSYGLSVYNVSRDSWHKIMPKSEKSGLITIPLFSECVAVQSAGKVVVLGGWDPVTLLPVPDVYIIDFTSGRVGGDWRRGAPMTAARSFFGCAAVGSNFIYVAGGHDGQKDAMRSAEVYDIQRDEWRMVTAMEEARDECLGISTGDGRFCVVSGYGSERQGEFRNDGEVYDPETDSWSKIENIWPFPHKNPRSTTTTASHTDNQRQWIWFKRPEEEEEDAKEVEKDERERNWNVIVKSVKVPGMKNGASGSCSLEDGDSFVFVKCEGEGGAMVMEKDRFRKINVPLAFSSSPFSVSSILV